MCVRACACDTRETKHKKNLLICVADWWLNTNPNANQLSREHKKILDSAAVESACGA